MHVYSGDLGFSAQESVLQVDGVTIGTSYRHVALWNKPRAEEVKAEEKEYGKTVLLSAG